MAVPERRRPSALRLLAAQVVYQLRVLVRSPIGSFATLVIPLMVLLAVNLLYRGTHLASRGGIATRQFFTPAMVAFAVVNACYMSVISATSLARDEGILKRLRGTPLPPWIYMSGRLASAGLVALISAVVVIAVGAGVYDFEVIWSAVPAALLVLAAAMFCFSALGMAVTVLVPRADSALPVASGDDPAAVLHIRRVHADRQRAALAARDRVVLPAAPVRRRAGEPVQPDPGRRDAALAAPGGPRHLGRRGGRVRAFTFRWEPGSPGRAGAASSPRAAFAVSRVRGMFERAAERPPRVSSDDTPK